MSSKECLLEIYYHVAKLQKALRDNNADLIVEYSADIANLSMMMVDINGELKG